MVRFEKLGRKAKKRWYAVIEILQCNPYMSVNGFDLLVASKQDEIPFRKKWVPGEGYRCAYRLDVIAKFIGTDFSIPEEYSEVDFLD